MNIKNGQCWKYTEPNYSARFVVEATDKINDAVVLKCYCIMNVKGYTEDFETGHEYTFRGISLDDATKWTLLHNAPVNDAPRQYDNSLN